MPYSAAERTYEFSWNGKMLVLQRQHGGDPGASAIADGITSLINGDEKAIDRIMDVDYTDRYIDTAVVDDMLARANAKAAQLVQAGRTADAVKRLRMVLDALVAMAGINYQFQLDNQLSPPQKWIELYEAQSIDGDAGVYGVSRDSTYGETLANYALLLRKIGRNQEAAELVKLAGLKDDDDSEALRAALAGKASAPPRLVLPEPAKTAGQSYLAKAAMRPGWRWPLDRLPIHVFIKNEAPADQAVAIRQALADWSAASGGIVKFDYVSSAEKANILVQPTDNDWVILDKNEGGLAQVDADAHGLTRATVFMRTKLNGKWFTPLETYKLALHEIGHALGLEGHSSNNHDIMYSDIEATTANSLSADDVATIRALYEEKNSIDLSNYVAAKNMNLKGIDYAGRRNYQAAVKCFTQALQIDPTFRSAEQNLSRIYSKMASDSLSHGNNALAERYFLKAIEHGKNGYRSESYAETLSGYAQLLRVLHRMKEAELYDAQAFGIRSGLIGP
jgi:tetratricopeptide (TPR) repeat protein